MSKKERERLERQKAEKESKARNESKDRQERIKVLWKALTSGSLAPKDKESADSEPLRSLVELVDLQKREIEYLTQFRREQEWIRAGCAAQQSGKLGIAAILLMGETHPFTRKSDRKFTAKQKAQLWYLYKRRGYDKDGIGEIERQFGLG